LPLVARHQKKAVGRIDATYSYIRLQTATMTSFIQIDKVCKLCGGNFIARTFSTQCCSDDCAKRYYKKRKRDEKIKSAIEKENTAKPYNPVVNEKDYLSINEACMLLGASRWTIYRMIESGNLTAAKFGRRTIIKKSTIESLFKN